MRQRWGVIVVVSLISFLSGGWLLQRGTAAGGNVYQQARLFDDVLGHVSAYYVDSLGETDLYEKATEGMLEQLKDPYSVLLTGDDYKALTEQTRATTRASAFRSTCATGGSPSWRRCPRRRRSVPASRRATRSSRWTGSPPRDGRTIEAVKALRGTRAARSRSRSAAPESPSPIGYRLTRAQIHIRSVPAGDDVRRRRRLHLAEPGERDLRRRAAAGNHLDEEQGDEVAHPRPAVQPGRPARPGRRRSPTSSSMPSRRSSPPAAAPAARPSSSSTTRARRGPTCRSSCWSTRAPPAPRRSSPARSRTTTARSSSARPPSARGWCRRSSRWATASRSSSRPRTGTRRAAAPSSAPRRRGRSDRAGRAGGRRHVPDGPQVSARPAIKARPVYHTEAGRTVRGGGGIVPDIVIRPDTLTRPSGHSPRRWATVAGLPGRAHLVSRSSSRGTEDHPGRELQRHAGDAARGLPAAQARRVSAHAGRFNVAPGWWTNSSATRWRGTSSVARPSSGAARRTTGRCRPHSTCFTRLGRRRS